ncbi:MAG: hypothetical protein OQK03_13105 [Colwellia sp.]|nr:hypothetical protein [Colwellia sp.]
MNVTSLFDLSGKVALVTLTWAVWEGLVSEVSTSAFTGIFFFVKEADDVFIVIFSVTTSGPGVNPITVPL